MSGMSIDTHHRINAMTRTLQDETLEDRIDYLEWSIREDQKQLRELRRELRLKSKIITKNDEHAIESINQQKAFEIEYGFKDNGK